MKIQLPTILFKKVFFLFLFLLIFNSPKAFTQNRSADSLALKAIYDNMGGSGWTDNTGWPGPGPISTWSGVGFDGSRVITLSLGDNNLTGAVPIEIGNMDALQSLDLQNNGITSIPDEIGNLAALATLSLQENQLTALPAGLGNASSLVFLDVNENQLSSLPNELFNLSGLSTLRAEFNQITSLPTVIDGLISLTQLELDGNQITTLPAELFNLTSLVNLSIEENQLITFPTAITNLLNLTILSLGDNQISGLFPTEVLSLTNLTQLNLSNNQFSGAIPAGISALIALNNLNLEGNDFNGSIPTSINSLSILQSLSLGSNQFSGNIPTEIGTMSNLTGIDLSNNQFDGALPGSFTGLTNLQELYLFDNDLTGLPDLTSMINLSDLIVSGNLIPEADITTNLSVLTDDANQQQFTNASVFNYDVSSTIFGYSIFSDPTIVTLQDDSVTFNAIPIGFDFDFFGSSYNSIYISSNGFITFLNPDINGDAELDSSVDGCCSGQEVPLSIYPNAYIAGYWEDLDPTQGGTIQYENLGSEFIVEFIGVQHLNRPESVSFQIKLIEGSNNIEIHCSSCPQDNDSEVATQAIEDELGFQGFAFAGRSADVFDLTSDAVLFMPEALGIDETDSLALVALYQSTDGANWNDNTNWLVGTLDTWLGVTVTDGRVSGLDLNNNNLNGPLPDEIGDLTNLETLNLASNLLIGSIPTTIGSLISLTDMNLLDNALTGTIPAEINNLIFLTSIQLQTNQFSGAIPDFSNLIDLSNFAISSNMVSGQIPEYIGSLQSLNQLFLSGNELTGTVPDTLGTLTNLTFLRLDNNQLSDSIPSSFVNLVNINNLLIHNNSFTHLPDLSTLSSLSNFNVSDNFFTFEDLEVNSLIITSNTDQKNFGSIQNLSLPEGDQIILNAQIPGNGTNDAYQWQKEGSDLPGEVSSILNKAVSLLTDSGTYRLKVTNSSFPGLEIFSEEITLTIEGDPDLAFVDALSDPVGKVWRMAPIAGALKVGPAPDDGSFFSNTIDDLITRDCYFDDTYTFFDDGTFIIDIQGQTFVEAWQGDEFSAEACDDPTTSTLNDYNLLGGGTFSFDLFNTSSSNLRVNGKGAYLGLPKAYNGGSYDTTLDSLRNSVVYEVLSFSDESLVLTIDIGSDIWWTFSLSAPPRPINETDSLALVALYNSTNGANWNINTNWLIGSVGTWHGVTVSGGRVTQLELNDNNLTGSLPDEIGDLSQLESFNASFNSINSIPNTFTNLSTTIIDGSLEGNQIEFIPDLSVVSWSSLVSFSFAENNLSFDAIGASSSVSTFVFDPQIFITTETYREVDEGDNLVIDPGYSGTGDQFQWYRGGAAITGATSSTLDLSPVDLDAGESYQLEVQSSGQPGIRLLSEYVQIVLVSCPSYSVTINTDIFWQGETQNGAFGNIGLNELITIDAVGDGQYQISDYTGSFYEAFGGGNVSAIITDNCGSFSGLTLGDAGFGQDDIVSISYNAVTPELTIEWYNPSNDFTEVTVFTESDTVLAPINESDSLALVAFYNAAGGASWTNNGGWLSRPAASWFGVTTENGRVTELQLEDDGSNTFPGNNLSGTIAPEIGDLDSLRFLNLSQSNLSGEIPVEISNLTKLETLWIRTNQLSGAIPSEIGNLTNLVSVTLADNQLSGLIPSEIGSLTQLDLLYLNNNQLSGEIPSSLGNLAFLSDLDLSQNQLTGSIPAEFADLDNLQNLRLWFNQLSGAIPPEVGDMISLIEIDFNGNQFSGSIPVELGQLSNLTNLSIPGNQLSGSLPIELSGLTNLRNLWLDNNELTGSIPAEFDSLVNLETISLVGNQLSGVIPELTSLTRLVEIKLSGNEFTGQVPDFIGNNIDLSIIDISLNDFDGAIPTNFNQLVNSQQLNIRENSLEDLPNLSNLTGLFLFDVSLNQFGSADINPNIDVITQNDGQIGSTSEADSLVLIDLYNALGGSDWPQGQNWIDIDTAVWAWPGVGVLDQRVISLNINGFDTESFANVPGILSGLDSLENLGIANNGLTTIPDNISSLTNLKILTLANNSLTTLPNTLVDLSNIEEIYAQNNNLISLPDLNGLPQPIVLNVTNNNLFYDDLIPNAGIDGIIFSPQKNLSSDEVIGLTLGENVTLSVDTSSFDVNDALIWKKDGEEIPGAIEPDFTIASFVSSDVGIYTFEFANPALTDLILTSGRFTLLEKSEGAFTWIYDDNFVKEGQDGATYGGFVADYNNDGFDDIYTMNLDTVSSYLYRNNGDGTFTQTSGIIPGEAAYGHAWADVNNDGFLDLLAADVNFTSSSGTRDGIASLYMNNGGNSFDPNPLDGAYYSVAFGDINNDGWVDAVAIDTSLDPQLFLNDSTGGLVKQVSPISNGEHTSAISNPFLIDVNGDGLLDLYRTGNERSLHKNDGDGVFIKEETDPLVTTEISGAWGASWGDLDNDGDIDAFVRAYLPGTDSYFFYNDGDGNFTGQTGEEVLGESCERGRASVLADINNDGYMDIIFNERSSGSTDTIKIYLNNANTGYSLIEDQNFIGTQILRGLSVIDYDNDGFLDIYSPSTINTDPNMLYRNNGNSNNWLKVKLEGTTSNRAGVGAEVSVYAGSLERYQQVITNSGLHSGNSYNLHYGLGVNVAADSIVVNWPSGLKSIVQNVTANQLLEIQELGIPEIAFDSLALKSEEFRPELFGSVSDTSATIQIELQGNFYDAVNNMDSTWTLAAATVDSLFNGTYEVIARATNIVGVGVDTAMLVIDQSAPFVAIDALISTVRSPELTGFVDDTTATVSVIVEENDYPATVNTSDGTWALAEGEIQPPLEDGTYDILVLAENRFGVASDTTTNELRLDATAPEVFVDNIGTSITSPELTGFISDTTATLIVNVEGRGDFIPIINRTDSTWSIAEGTITPSFTEEDSPIAITATAEDSLANIGMGTGQIVITTTILALEPSRVTSNSFRANWSAVVDVESYTLEVSDADDFSNILVNENTTATSFDVEDLDFETEYFYRATFDNGVDAPTTSDPVALSTIIKPGTIDDFNSLLQIESATGGSNWAEQSNWIGDTRKQDWLFIELENERIVEVNIPGNNLTGIFPYTPLMTQLRKVDISDNIITDIGNLTRLRSIEELDASNNLFEFDDLEKLKELATFVYSPQKTILSFNEKTIADSLLIRVFSDPILSIPAKGEYVSYDWFLNDNPIDTGDDFIKDDSLLHILSIDYDNMGKFKAEVRNDSLPDLTLKVDSMFVFAVADFSVDVNDENGTLIPDNVDGYLLLTTQGDRGFDTLSVSINQPSSFTFNDVILGNYLISIDSDREKYVPTYYADAFEWVDADTVQFRKDTSFQLSMTIIPKELTEEDGIGTLGVVIEEDFGDDAGRIDARRRAARRKCGLRRKTGGGRTDADDDGFELIAYGETNDNGEFEFGFLPEGTYRFFVEYPGIPLDESSFVEFEVGELGISETDFKLEAFASEDGIEVIIDKVLGVIFDYFKNLEVYPNPASDVLKISYRHLASRNVGAKLVDLLGNVLWSTDIKTGYDGYEEVDVSEFESGMYILYVYDKENSKENVASYRIIIQD